MKAEFPWQVDGGASRAAPESGMTLGEWLDALILNSARPDRPCPRETGSRSFESPPAAGARLSPAPLPAFHPGHAPLSPAEDVLARAAALAERLALVRGEAPAAPAAAAEHRPHGSRARERVPAADKQDGLLPHGDDASRQLVAAIASIERRLDQLIAGQPCGERPAAPVAGARRDTAGGAQQARGQAASSLEQALAEIATRQRALDADISMSPAVEALPRARTQDFSALEQQLRQINAQIEGLKQPISLDRAVDMLRDDLAEIGAMLAQAMPRQALESLESELRRLAGRIDETRQAGLDDGALAGIERALSEMRDALRALSPAESLTGLGQAIEKLSQRIDLAGRDPQSLLPLGELESIIPAMREAVSRVASDESLARLSAEVRALSERLEEVAGAAGGRVVAALEARIAMLADALEAHNRSGHDLPRAVDAVVADLMARMERAQPATSDQPALAELQDRMSRLAEKLDSSDARLQHLAGIDRGLTELLLHLERRSVNAENAAAALAPERSGPPHADRQTRDALAAVHGTLGHVVDRLATIEASLQASRLAPAGATAPAAPVAAGASAPQPAIAENEAGASLRTDASAGERAQEACELIAPPGRELPGASSERRPIDPTLPPDHPLEPGIGLRNRQPASAADRIAASEAALAGARPPAPADAEGRSSFIAAARRAAQAAGREAPRRDAQARSEIVAAVGMLATRIGKLRAVLGGTAAVVLVLGAMQTARVLLADTDDPAATAVAAAALPSKPSPVTSLPNLSTLSSSTPGALPLSSSTLKPASPAPDGGGTSPSREEGGTAPASGTLAAAGGQAAARQDALLASAPRSTGSLPLSVPAAAMMPAPSMNSARSGAATQLPVFPGAAGLPPADAAALRAAAGKGSAAAQYELGARLLEGRGVAQSFTEAADWLERAAKQGLAPAQFRLGGLYEKGLGVTRSLERARQLYGAAGEAGNAKALHNLAVLHAEGIDGKPDYQSAARWFLKAAALGMTDSQYNLAVLYARGIGIEQSLSDAYKWFALAAREGDAEAARKRDDVAGRLDPQSLAAASRAIEGWRPQEQPRAAVEVVLPAEGWESTAQAPSRRKTTGTAPAMDLTPAHVAR
jgi:localization factor PodJL